MSAMGRGYVVERSRFLLTSICEGILDNPKSVKIEIAGQDNIIELRVDDATPGTNLKSELGRLIGREHQTIDAIRRLLMVLGARYQFKLSITVGHGEGGERHNGEGSYEEAGSIRRV